MRTHKTIEEWIEEGNLWKKMEVKKSINVQQYGRDAGKVHYPTNAWVNDICVPAGMKYEFRNIHTGKIKKITGTSTYFKKVVEAENANRWDTDQIPIDQEINLDDYVNVMLWQQSTGWGETKKPNVYVPCDDVEFRIEDDLLRHTWWVMNTVKIGDFVKCTGTRSGDWNKVESISKTRSHIYGPKYSKPEEGKMRYASSDNSMVKIKRIIRDGKEILPPK